MYPIIRPKNHYHPIFTMLYKMQLLPHDVLVNIPYATRNDWQHRNLQTYEGAEHCALYEKHFQNLAQAHKYTYTRYTLNIALAIIKTFVSITDSSLIYKKLLRSKAQDIVQHITTLARKGFSVKQACKLFAIKPSWYNYHKRKLDCPQSKLRLCFRKHPQQLSYQEQSKIYNWINKDENLYQNLTHLYYKAMVKGILYCSYETFKLFAYKAGYKKAYRKPKAKNKKGFRATAIFEYLHIDTTYIQTTISGLQKVIMVRDNYSKAILHWLRLGLQEKLNSQAIKQVLIQTFDKYKLFERAHHINIISDGGPENQGEVLTWAGNLIAPPCVKKITAKTEQFTGSNSMSEGGFHLFKHDWLKGKTVYDEHELDKQTQAFANHIGHRYFGELHGETPNTVLAGATVDYHKFKHQKQQAKTQRIAQNKAFKCTAMQTCA
jgi:hypothetical protein